MICLQKSKFADYILCDDSTGCDWEDKYFVTEAATMTGIPYEYDLMKICLEYLHLTGTFVKLSCLNVTLLLLHVPISIF